jgi:uncharacterized protein (TIGR02452 family)
MKRSQLVATYKDTIGHGRRYGGRFDQSVLYDPNDIPDWDDISAEPSKKGPGRGMPTYKPEILVENTDTLTAAREQDPEAKILVLIMASDHCPGGGVAKGSEAQEEDIYRCTNMFHCSNKSFYPLKAEQFIVTEEVTVFKDSEYELLSDPVQFDFISMPAVRKPGIVEGTYMDDSDEESMKARIDLIFRYAALESYDTLVLGALGCGAFGNPASDVANMFRNAIEAHGGYFKRIVFAVLSTSEKDKNYNIFNSILVLGRSVAPEPESVSDGD